MDIYVARQPILDVKERVVGYELLHRIRTNARSDPIVATTQLLSEHLLADAWDQLTGGRMAWVRFPTRLLLDDTVLLAPADRTVIQVNRTDATNDVLTVCEELVARGYVLAADEVRDPDDDSALLDLAKFVKVDFGACDPTHRERFATRFAGRTRLVADRVENREDQATAIALGYGLLQGRFLSKPALVSRRAIDRTRAGVMAAMAAAMRNPMDFAEVEQAIKGDVALTDRLLRYLNSAAFGLRDRVSTINYALVALGERQVRRWVTINALAAIDTSASRELLVSTLFRARMCERLTTIVHFDADPFELFLTGMYSQVHLLLGKDLESTLDEVPIPAIVRDALLDHEGPLWHALDLVVAWEHGDWDRVNSGRDRLAIDAADLSECYIGAINFADTAGDAARDGHADAPVPAA